jgi:hypothetical protein
MLAKKATHLKSQRPSSLYKKYMNELKKLPEVKLKNFEKYKIDFTVRGILISRVHSHAMYCKFFYFVPKDAWVLGLVSQLVLKCVHINSLGFLA